MVDNVNHPKHYADVIPDVECIEVARTLSFNCGNVVKYVWRAGVKVDANRNIIEKEIEDINKAIFYIKDEIANRPSQLIGESVETVDQLFNQSSDWMKYIVSHFNENRRNVILYIVQSTQRINAHEYLQSAQYYLEQERSRLKSLKVT